jgi:hypothetical protein
MPVIKAIKGEENITAVIPEEDKEQIIKELKQEGYTNIHDAETNEQFN